MSKEFKVQPLPVGHKSGWEVRINGETREVRIIELISKFGTLTYGYRPEGYDGWAFREAGGGGVVTLFYSLSVKHGLLIGLLQEKRPNMGPNSVWCIPGGFVEPGEKHKDAAIREAAEETGVAMNTVEELPGLPINSHRAFFVADVTIGEGLHAYAHYVQPGDLQPDNNHCWRLKDAALIPGFNKAGGLHFFPWKEAVHRTADALTRSAIAQLLALIL